MGGQGAGHPKHPAPVTETPSTAVPSGLVRDTKEGKYRRIGPRLLNPLMVLEVLNLAAPDGARRRRSVKALIDELQRCEVLGVQFLVLHPGAHLTATPAEDSKASCRRVGGLILSAIGRGDAGGVRRGG